ncbi:hypothetical protein SCP_0509930 [Sparassis crispa]|uniref:DUF6533 domain-containing protein n=1 Tax=Sparassis crispa TaxID=139825 RepID=A0A401GQB1_9APHY|nr:hypothetical protein SCP_0509930 [Sparassis crispa]GBE83934.1 hypothetical protein SCP_0509930 [Sparassis crispa]
MVDPHDVATRISSGDVEGIACYYCAVVCLLWYDYLLTFSEEVQYIWKSRLSVSSVLFYVIRYSALLSSICEVLATQGWLKNHRSR